MVGRAPAGLPELRMTSTRCLINSRNARIPALRMITLTTPSPTPIKGRKRCHGQYAGSQWCSCSKTPSRKSTPHPAPQTRALLKEPVQKLQEEKKSAAFEKEHKSQYQNHREIHGRNGKNCLAIHSREIKLRPSQPKTVPYR